MRLIRTLALLCSIVAPLTACATASGPATDPELGERSVWVDLLGGSYETRCAEEDNITAGFVARDVTALRIEAVHPPYLSSINYDSTRPDFTDCVFTDREDHTFEPRTLELYDDGDVKLVGHTFEKFWRPEDVTVAVDGSEEAGLHLLQVFLPHEDEWLEVLVLYPSDGYWRAKPLPPEHLAKSAYGSSFLIGPVEDGGRPMVRLSRVDFDPDTLSFTLAFAEGGSATLAIGDADTSRLRLDVTFDGPVGREQPFAALRSMHVTETVADVALVGWRESEFAPWRSRPILGLKRERASQVRFGREIPSRHNTSAPDMVFGPFWTGSTTR